MRLNKNGQALIEFILIVPVLLIILSLIIDFGQIMYTKNVLEAEVNYLVDDYKNKLDLTTEIKDAKIDINNEKNNIEIILSKEINILTPGLNHIIGNPYEASAKRVISNET